MPPRTVETAIAELNRQTSQSGGAGTWAAVPGVQSLTNILRQSPIEVQFQLGTGLLVKVFVNSDTGELRIFPAKLFGYPERDNI